ncbi:MAG: hypothetical protein GEV09_25535 [Pseudonocardiaceae bacterium]|nr:hypothetical protein [Pseudonocardiaceae bacterium]
MSAQPMHQDPDDPAEILQRLPERWHAEFLTEYHAALDAAHEVRQWQTLRALLHRWRLRAVALSDPGFEEAADEARRARPEDLTPVPDWADGR